MEAWEAKALEAWLQERVFAWQEPGPSSLAQLGRAQRENRQSPFVLGYSLLQDGASPESRAAELVSELGAASACAVPSPSTAQKKHGRVRLVVMRTVLLSELTVHETISLALIPFRSA